MPSNRRYPLQFERNDTIEAIFSPRNIDEDCHTIDKLLKPVYDTTKRFLENGLYTEAVKLYLQVLDSMTVHFIEDEHYCEFDDFYSPDYRIQAIWELFIPYTRSEKITGVVLSTLETGLEKIKETEAYLSYGYPSMIPFSDLRRAKTTVEKAREYLEK